MAARLSDAEDIPDEGVIEARGAITPAAIIAENIDLDDDEPSRTRAPTTPEKLTAEADEVPYSAFTEAQKWFIITLAAVGATTS